MVLAQRPLHLQIVQKAEQFIEDVREGRVDEIWNDRISLEAVDIVSMTVFPLIMSDRDVLDQLFDISDPEQMALAFQMDASNVRSEFFAGIAESLAPMYAENYSGKKNFVVVQIDGKAAVFGSPGGDKDVIVPFVRDSQSGEFSLDLVGLLVFAMFISASRVYQVGMQALTLGHVASAIRLFNLCGQLRPVYDRLRTLIWDHPLLKESVTLERRTEIQAEFRYTVLAQEQSELLVTSAPTSLPIELGHFMETSFAGYERITDVTIDDEDRHQLQIMPEGALRESIASVLRGVDAVVAKREARKPHSGYEISDMDVVAHYNGRDFNLAIPVKSGSEMAFRKSVPADVFHQLLRPHMNFHHSVVVFVTVKPCSQVLHNYILLARDRFGATIGVIEADDLTRLLKVNNLLQQSPVIAL